MGRNYSAIWRLFHTYSFCIGDLFAFVVFVLSSQLSFVLQSSLFALFSVVYFVIENVCLYNDHRSFFNMNISFVLPNCIFLPYSPPILKLTVLKWRYISKGRYRNSRIGQQNRSWKYPTNFLFTMFIYSFLYIPTKLGEKNVRHFCFQDMTLIKFIIHPVMIRMFMFIHRQRHERDTCKTIKAILVIKHAYNGSLKSIIRHQPANRLTDARRHVSWLGSQLIEYYVIWKKYDKYIPSIVDD